MRAIRSTNEQVTPNNRTFCLNNEMFPVNIDISNSSNSSSSSDISRDEIFGTNQLIQMETMNQIHVS